MLMKLVRSKYIKNVYVYVYMYIYVCVCVLVCVWIYIICIDMNQNDSAVLKLAFFRCGHQIVVKFAKFLITSKLFPWFLKQVLSWNHICCITYCFH